MIGRLIILCVVLFAGCTTQNENDVNIEFYHWKQSYDVPSSSQTKPKYIKIVDIGLIDTKLDIKYTKLTTNIDDTIEPVVYIGNEAMKNLNINSMIANIIAHLKKSSHERNYNYDTIGVDCDWSDDTRAKFFDFISKLKNISGKKIEVTLRLHQIKYASKTGVPPADSAILMYYNMSDFKNIGTKNYILDNDTGAKYMSGFDSYPLKLDLALPIYSQATIIRLGAVAGLMESFEQSDINTHWQKVAPNLYTISETHYFHGRLLYKNDKIRVDTVSIKELKNAIKLLKAVMKRPKNIVFYEWESRNAYDANDLKKLW